MLGVMIDINKHSNAVSRQKNTESEMMGEQ